VLPRRIIVQCMNSAMLGPDELVAQDNFN